MNTANRYTRVNLTIPTDIVEYVKRHAKNVSKYFSDAAEERIVREKRERALTEILAAKPTFRNIKDSASFVKNLREEDKKRDRRLGII